LVALAVVCALNAGASASNGAGSLLFSKFDESGRGPLMTVNPAGSQGALARA
jgi:hypothetical protein